LHRVEAGEVNHPRNKLKKQHKKVKIRSEISSYMLNPSCMNISIFQHVVPPPNCPKKLTKKINEEEKSVD
jgi:hypothetical protein